MTVLIPQCQWQTRFIPGYFPAVAVATKIGNAVCQQSSPAGRTAPLQAGNHALSCPLAVAFSILRRSPVLARVPALDRSFPWSFRASVWLVFANSRHQSTNCLCGTPTKLRVVSLSRSSRQPLRTACANRRGCPSSGPYATRVIRAIV